MILEAAQKMLYPGLLAKIEPYRIKTDAEMPLVYQKTGRPLHDDWFIGKKTPRLGTGYRPPFPFNMMQGNAVPQETPLPVDYPLVPGTVSEIKPWWDGKDNVPKKWIWMVHPIQPADKWAELMVYLPDKTWEPCFRTQSLKFLGKHKLVSYMGLKPDPHPVDCAAWFPELCPCSIKWGSLE